MNEHKEPFLFKSYERIIGIAHDVNELKNELERLSKVDPDAVNYHLKEKHIVNWLNYIGETELAKKLENVKDIKEAIAILEEENKQKINKEQKSQKEGMNQTKETQTVTTQETTKKRRGRKKKV